MDPITMAIIGGAASAGSALIGGIGSAIANSKAKGLIDTQRKENKAWYNDQMAQDYTQRTDTQALLKKQKEMLDEYYGRAQGTAAVSGGTDEAVAMQKEQANKSVADTMTNVAAQAQAHKDAAEQQYRQQDAALNQQQASIAQGQANAIAQAAGQGVSAGLNLMGTAIGKEPTK